MLCSRCQKRPAVVFVSTGSDGSDTKGYCLSCAKELNIKQVTDIMNQMGISEEDFDAMQEQMDELMSADTDMQIFQTIAQTQMMKAMMVIQQVVHQHSHRSLRTFFL